MKENRKKKMERLKESNLYCHWVELVIAKWPLFWQAAFNINFASHWLKQLICEMVNEKQLFVTLAIRCTVLYSEYSIILSFLAFGWDASCCYSNSP